MPRALCLLPEGPNYRRQTFIKGLQAAGYEVVGGFRPEPADILVQWNRKQDLEARRFEAVGAKVLIVENGYFGKVWNDRKWFAISIGHHAGAGEWRYLGPERWDSWAVDLKPWKAGKEVVVLGQRGIGEPGVASPHGWAETVARKLGGRVRPHPGKDAPQIALETDLTNARCVVTWASGAGLLSMALGTPVFHAFDRWIGREACRPLSEFGEPLMDDEKRLSMFRKMAWAMWTAEEVESGYPFEVLCKS